MTVTLPLAAIAIVVSDVAVAMLDDWSRPALLEAAILFDLGLLIPALYWWCHRARGKAAVLRAIGLGCLGVWVAGHVVPDEHHAILGTVGAIRYLGLAILVAIELKLVAHVLRATFGRNPDARASVLATAQDAGLPCDNGIEVDERCRTVDPAIIRVGRQRHPAMAYERQRPGPVCRCQVTISPGTTDFCVQVFRNKATAKGHADQMLDQHIQRLVR